MPATAPVATVRALAPRALLVALATGVLADVVVRVLPQGVDLVAIVGVVLAALVLLARAAAIAIPRTAWALGVVALLFAAATLLRDAPQLVVFDTLAVLSALTALVAVLRGGDAMPAHDDGGTAPLRFGAGAITTAARVAAGGPQLAVRALDAQSLPRGAALASAGTLVRGGFLAAPVLLVFGLLLLSADPAFARLLVPLESFDVVAEHLVVTGIVAWGTAGTLHAALLAGRGTTASTPDDGGLLAAIGRALRERLDALRIGVREVTVALVLVDLLLLAFVVLQLRWLAGGASALVAEGFTVAGYARRGFGELVALSVLSLPLLVVAHAIAGDRATRAFRVAAGALLALLLLLALSAGDRMRLYMSSFGLTEQRLYASALLTWLAFVFAWAAATLLRGHGRRFAVGALVGAWTTLLALHVLNPDARIAEVNLARGAEGKPLDARYLGRLSPDAAPVLAARVPALAATHPDPAVRCALVRALHAAAVRADAGGEWRGWRYPVVIARAALPASARAVPPRCA
jgi:hypothetical protein